MKRTVWFERTSLARSARCSSERGTIHSCHEARRFSRCRDEKLADGLRVLCTRPADDVPRTTDHRVRLRDVREAWLRNPRLPAPWAEERCVFWLPGDCLHTGEVSEGRLS